MRRECAPIAADELADACDDEGMTDLIEGHEVDAALKTRRLCAALGGK